MKRFCINGIILLFIAFIPALVHGQENLTLDFQVGFDAFYKSTNWVPIRVTVANQGADIQAQLQLQDIYPQYGTSPALYVYPVSLPGQSRKEFTIYAPLHGQHQLTLELVNDAGQSLVTQKQMVSALALDMLLVGVVSKDTSLLNGLTQFTTPSGNRIAVAHLTLDDLPDDPRAWNSLDWLVINNVDTAQLDTAQQQALQTWLRSGGHLLVAGGPNANQTTAGLSPLLPFSAVVMETLPHPLNSLQQFSTIPLNDRGPYIAAIPQNTSGQTIVQEGDYPLVVSNQWGKGRVHYLALDLALAPLDFLTTETALLDQIIGKFWPRTITPLNSVNMSQIRNSLGYSIEQNLPTPWTVALFLGAYILMFGPVNYVILGRLKRREWAWLTMPLLILLFGGYGYFTGFRLRPQQTHLQQIAVIQAEAGAPMANLDTFVGVYSPTRTNYTLEIDNPSVLVESLPNSLGRNIQLTVTTLDPLRIENLQGDIGGINGIIAHSHLPAPAVTINVNYNQTQAHFEGTIINETGSPISQVLLIAGDEISHIGTLPPGETSINNAAYTISYNLPLYDEPGLEMGSEKMLDLASKDTAVRAVLGFNSASTNIPTIPTIQLVGWQSGSPLNVSLTPDGDRQKADTLLVLESPYLTSQTGGIW